MQVVYAWKYGGLEIGDREVVEVWRRDREVWRSGGSVGMEVWRSRPLGSCGRRGAEA